MSQTLVIPCYNEATRLPLAQVRDLLERAPSVHLLFVDDGSTDATSDLLQSLERAHPGRVRSVTLVKNSGKAEAVRQGLLKAMEEGAPQWVGYADADFATPASELSRLLSLAADSKFSVLLGSRVKLLGTDIERKAWRHYLGRVFATMASQTLRLPVYDTQCGAKVFRTSEGLRRALQTPFFSRWAFDVELIGRLNLQYTQAEFVEVPLQIWHDIGGSKLKGSAMIKAALDLLWIAVDLRRRRKSNPGAHRP